MLLVLVSLSLRIMSADSGLLRVPEPQSHCAAHTLHRNGCTIGCSQCDGVTRGPIPDMTQHPCVDQGNSGPGPSTVKPGTPCAKQPALDPAGHPGCGKAFKATNCDPRTRSVNRGATCGAPDDYYYYSPWRAPGEAPVFDAWSVLRLTAPPRATHE